MLQNIFSYIKKILVDADTKSWTEITDKEEINEVPAGWFTTGYRKQSK